MSLRKKRGTRYCEHTQYLVPLFLRKNLLCWLKRRELCKLPTNHPANTTRHQHSYQPNQQCYRQYQTQYRCYQYGYQQTHQQTHQHSYYWCDTCALLLQHGWVIVGGHFHQVLASLLLFGNGLFSLLLYCVAFALLIHRSCEMLWSNLKAVGGQGWFCTLLSSLVPCAAGCAIALLRLGYLPLWQLGSDPLTQCQQRGSAANGFDIRATSLRC